MARLRRQDPYSYRADPAVPDFDDRQPIAFMDGDCTLCTTGARLIGRYDRRGEFRICPIQSDLGRAILIHYGVDPDSPETWLYLVDGRAYTSVDAMIRAGRRVGGPGWLLQPFRIVPRPVQDWLYRRIARNRYAVLGRTPMCAVPDPELRRRLLE